MNLTSRQKKTVLAVSAVLFLLVAVRLVNTAVSRDLVLHITPSGATVKIDDEIRSGNTSFKVDTGSHDLYVSKDGYLPQHQVFSSTKGKTTTLTINLVKKTPASLTERLFRDTIYPDNSKQDIKVLTSKELYGGAWVLGTVLVGGEEERAVLLQQDSSSDTKYVLYLAGPPFDQSKFKLLPTDVQSEITTVAVGAGD